MNAPIPVSEALKLLSMAIEDCDKATPGPWEQDDDCRVFAESVPDRIHEFGFNPRIVCETDQQREQAGADMDLIVLARATMRPMLEYVQLWVRMYTGEGVAAITPEGWAYPPLAALRDHYDAVRPGWRER